MGAITTIDQRFLDDVFASERGAGYVLDFTDRSFSEFFRKDLKVDIDHQRYCQAGTSKGKRLRAFLQLEPDTVAARALRALWDYKLTVSGPIDNKDEKARHQSDRFFALVHRLDGKGGLVRQAANGSSSALAGPSQTQLSALNDELLKLTAMTAQARGFAFETFLSELFSLYNLAPRRSFRNTGEQIDGSFDLQPETFLLEAKWQDAPIGQADLLTFSGKVEGKALWSRGLFVSYSSFSKDGLEAFATGRRTAIICMDGFDVSQILSGGLNFVDVIQRKKRRAAETNRAFVSVRDLF